VRLGDHDVRRNRAEEQPSFRFSFVVSTIGRPAELKRLFDSLVAQGEESLQVIVVEQNDDRVSAHLVEEGGWPFTTVYVPMKERGLSRGRNAGLAHVRGEVVAFPDDNCWYEPGALSFVTRILESRPELGGVSLRQVDPSGADSIGRWHSRRGSVTRWNLIHRVTSSSLFLRRDLVERVGVFNEELGVGSGTPWGAGEENDYVSRAVALGAKIHYEPVGLVLQEDWRNDPEEPTRKVYAYNCGFARSLRLNGYPAWFMAYYVLRQMGAYLRAVLLRDARARRTARAAIQGRIHGWSGRAREDVASPAPVETSAENPFQSIDVVRRLRPLRRYVDYIHLSDLLAALESYEGEIGGHVLDFGSGTAPYQSLFKQASRYNAADFAVNTFADTVLTPEGRVPLDDDAVDAILSIQVLEHVPDPGAYLRECARVMRAGGTLLLTTHGMWEFHAVPKDLHRWTHQGLSELLETEGFEPVAVVGLSDGTRGAIQLLQLSLEHKRLPFVVRGLVRVCLNTIADLRILEKERVRPASESLMPIAYLVLARKTGT
jgi:SAM-dependent methyltransferase